MKRYFPDISAAILDRDTVRRRSGLQETLGAFAMAFNSIYAAGTHKSVIEEAEPGSMETNQYLRHFGLSLWLAEKIYKSQMGKTIGSFGGMPSAAKRSRCGVWNLACGFKQLESPNPWSSV